MASILVMETDPAARERITRELRKLGYSVSEINDVLPTGSSQPNPAPETVDAGGISVDTVGHRVDVDGAYVTLAPREYRLLLFLLRNQERVFSRKQLLANVWDRDSSVGPRTVDVHIRRLRSVLETYGYDRYIQTVRGAGYRFSVK